MTMTTDRPATDRPATDRPAAGRQTAAVLPGRALDVIAAAARGAGIGLHSMWLGLTPDGTVRSITAHLVDDDVATAVALFAVLGVTATVSEPYGEGSRRQANVTGAVAALDVPELLVIVTKGLPADDETVAELVAEVDTRRADDATDGPSGGAL